MGKARGEKGRTKDSVAPAEQPVRMASGCVIFSCPKASLYVFPQKSLEANLIARLGASSRLHHRIPSNRE